ncbi:MAG TPA: glycosyltransferase family 4 protein, partial [Ignavibacteria bacterium]|nr:glycosyltransferase family 4 protein [Ignavibacteria bacterium]
MKRRILHISPDMGYNDGRSYYVYLLLKYLKRNGHEVFLCSNNPEAKERISDTGAEFFLMKELGDKKKLLKGKSVLTDFVEKKRIEVIHSHHRFSEFIANSVRKKTGVKTVFTALSIVDKRYFIEYRSDRLIAVSNSVKKMLINKFGVDGNKIHLIPNFTDTEELTDKIPLTEDVKKYLSEISQRRKVGFKIILTVGRFHKDKDQITLLKASESFKDNKFYFVFIGSGELYSLYSEFIKEKSINAILIPSQKDLRPFYEAADICVLCSLTEPLSGFLLQSGLFSKPFIGSDAEGILEVVRNNDNGLIFKRGDSAELKNKIFMLSEDSNLSGLLSAKLHEDVMKSFTEKTVMPQIEE